MATEEFPASVGGRPNEMTRREFFRVSAAAAALAGLGGCTAPPSDPILPFVTREPMAPDVPAHYATTMTLDGDGVGLIVESHTGRPTKIEGNPLHPASLGATGAIHQASLLELYDPDRLRAIRQGGIDSTWAAFRHAHVPTSLASRAGTSGAGLRLLLEPSTSPLLRRQLDLIRERFPAARVYFHSGASRHEAYEGARLAFGRPLQPQLALDRADVIVAFDADFLNSGPFALRYARQWADRRRVRASSAEMNRLYVAESALGVTGMSADERVAVRPADMATLVDALVDAIDGQPDLTRLSQDARRWIVAAARDLADARGRGIIVVGDRQPAATHAVAHALNARLGNLGQTITFIEPTWFDAGAATHTLAPLVDELRSGDVSDLIVVGANPVYTAAADLELSRSLRRVPHVTYVGLHENETAHFAEWVIPQAHYLESWGDARAYDGTVSIVQPLVAPLFGGRTSSEVLAVMAGQSELSAYRLARNRWIPASLSDDAWDDACRLGVIEGTASAAVATPNVASLEALRRMMRQPTSRGERLLEVLCPIDNRVYDGRFANNAWLQELPDPVSKLTWGNAGYVSPRTAAAFGVATGDMIELRTGGQTVQLPAFVLAGTADQTVVVPLGYGRAGQDQVARQVGVSVMPLRSSGSEYVIGGVTLQRVFTKGQDGAEPSRQRLAVTQEHWATEGRPVALMATRAAFLEDPDIAHQPRLLPTLYDPFAQQGVQWAMAIDLTVCTGCSACVVACQAENNIPVVGREGVLEAREMHWLRIDRYADGHDAGGRSITQPMLCQHCEKAPCEYVCPVNATVHSPDGLNEMVYNRCVGTRFCSNNCPYKVRRFNWFDYNAHMPEVQALGKNPEVTVRERGVMEKCTFCVQRIRTSAIRARVAGGQPDPDEVKTACEQACPTQAIVFGSLQPGSSDVAALHRQPHAYAALHELGTNPRVKYLARITNPSSDEDTP